MHRTMDARRLNAVANHADVRPWVGGEGEIDLSATLADTRNIALEWEHGGFVLTQHAPGTYESHTLFAPEGWGAYALNAAREGLRYLFTATDCCEVVTKVAATNRAAASFAREVGFDPIFKRAKAWNDEADVTFYALTFDRWRARDPEISAIGHAFHGQLEAAKAATGSPLPQHPDDDAHDRAVGAAMLMVKAGLSGKAVASYNRWAALAGYAQVGLLSVAPPIIDILDAVVTLRNGEMEVLTCR